MADQTQTPTVLVPNTASAAITPITITSSNEGLITLGSDMTIFRLHDVTGGSSVTFTASADGTHRLQSTLVVTLGSTETKYVAIQSARFKDLATSGDEGCVRLTINNDAYVETVELP
jgi:hypothetical protein